jgi:hypothetical protein
VPAVALAQDLQVSVIPVSCSGQAVRITPGSFASIDPYLPQCQDRGHLQERRRLNKGENSH